MRITAGQFRGREITAPKGLETRPSLSVVREALFNIIQGKIEGASWLDLFSGSGIMAFEALSRGASKATLIDISPASKKAILTNAEKLDVPVDFIKRDVFKALETIGPHDIIFADPPYHQGLGAEVVKFVDQGNVLKEGGILIIEDGGPLELPPLTRLKLDKEKKYARSRLYFFSM